MLCPGIALFAKKIYDSPHYGEKMMKTGGKLGAGTGGRFAWGVRNVPDKRKCCCERFFCATLSYFVFRWWLECALVL